MWYFLTFLIHISITNWLFDMLSIHSIFKKWCIVKNKKCSVRNSTQWFNVVQFQELGNSKLWFWILFKTAILLFFTIIPTNLAQRCFRLWPISIEKPTEIAGFWTETFKVANLFSCWQEDWCMNEKCYALLKKMLLLTW